MNIGNMKKSRFISKTDLPAPPYGMQLTIETDVMEGNVAPDGQQPENKFLIKFIELDKYFVINITNAEMIGAILGSEETSDWKGGKVEMYYDPSIMMGPKKTGGIRFRPIPQAAPQPPVPPVLDDDIPM